MGKVQPAMISTDDTLEDSVFKAFTYYDGLVHHSIADAQKVLSKTQLMAMVILDTHEVLNIGNLAMWLAVSREQASRAISGLEEKGYIEKHRSAENWRNIEVVLTPDGKRFAKKMREQTLSALEKSLSVLSEEEISRLRFCSQQASLLLSEVVVRHAKTQEDISI
jgi:DNA-binding MarR family transcriptional regulator